MSITSFYYLALVGVGALVYYVIPKKMQWIELLLLSVVFYCFATTPWTLLYLAVTTILAYISTVFIDDGKLLDTRRKKHITSIMTVSIILIIAVWFVIKADTLIINMTGILRMFIPSVGNFSGFGFIGALGMGYYTLQIVGYILDCAWENIKPQKNPLKLFLFVSFFPQLITGPISRYSQLECLYEGHHFSYKNLTFGSQRILWGFFKKIVMAERLAPFIGSVYGDLDANAGYFHWLVFLLYPLQMYCDFSGCMDIVIGVAEIFDIRLPENFNSPFFSRTSKEFWQRWHITLGTWAKDYVLYPLLKSNTMVRFGKFAKRIFGKKVGKFITTSVGMFCLWMVMGIWHGAAKYIIGVSLWYWIILMFGDFLEPSFAKINKFFQIRTETLSWHVFQSVRTYLIYAVGAVFFRANTVGTALKLLASLVTMYGDKNNQWNPWIFFNGAVVDLGLSHMDINVLIIGVFMLFVVAVLREKYGYAREWIATQCLGFRWLIWLSIFVMVLVLGRYGPEFNASDFIYGGF